MNQTQQQVVELREALEREARRVARWAICCSIFALATSALVTATKSIVFVIVALFAWFFVWDRWSLWRFLILCLPSPNENQHDWLEKTVEGLREAPPWYRFSENLAAAMFLLCFGIITIVVMSTSGAWTRLLYTVCWLLIGMVLVIRRIARRRHKRKNSTAS